MFFHTRNVSFMSVLHLPCKLFHLFAGIEKSPLINNEVTNYMCTEKKIICTIWIICDVCFGKDYLRLLFPSLFKSGMYSKLNRLSSCTAAYLSWFCLFTRNYKVLFPWIRQWAIPSPLAPSHYQPTTSPKLFSRLWVQIQKIITYIISICSLDLLERVCVSGAYRHLNLHIKFEKN